MPHPQTRLILTLLSIKGVGRKSVASLVDRLPEHASDFSPQSLLELIIANGKGLRGVKGLQLDTVEEAALQADIILAQCKKMELSILVGCDIPAQLQSIPDPPVALYVKGSITHLNKPGVAVVGTRKATQWGYQSSYRLGEILAARDINVISGLALGCDTGAHQGCVNQNGIGIAILAHGLESVFPKSNTDLANEILDKGGCWLSEYPPNTPAHPSYFVSRNRLQSGLSMGVVVVETNIKSGTIQTVKFAQQQHRHIGCLSHPDPEQNMPGNNKIIASGVTALSNLTELTAFIDEVQSLSKPDELHSLLTNKQTTKTLAKKVLTAKAQKTKNPQLEMKNLWK